MNSIFFDELSMAAFREQAAAPTIRYDGQLPGPLATSELLSETVGLAGVALARLCERPCDMVEVDGRLCAFWALTSCQPIGWRPPEPWDPLSAVFKAADGWIRLHTNAPLHKAAALRALGGVDTREGVAKVISGQAAAYLEDRIIAEGGAAARMISLEDWQKHPQGRAVSTTPLVEWIEKSARAPDRLQQMDFGSFRPLAGVRVLDLTRVLAGPVATRTLAGFGAEVLRIDPVDWDDPGLLQDTTLGKRRAEIDLAEPAGRSRFEDLLRQADILVHGYRPGALERLGYGHTGLDQINPRRIDVSLSAYGTHGPWAERRGFDSLVQFSSGIADLCSDSQGIPGKLPVQALDHAAGYIMAACCLEALRIARFGRIMAARTSLARIAWLLCNAPCSESNRGQIPPHRDSDFIEKSEVSDWGEIKRLRAPLSVSFAEMHWDIPSGILRKHPAVWSSH